MSASVDAPRFAQTPVTLSVRDSIGILLGVVAPLLIKGPIIRRRAGMGLIEKLDLDRRAVERLRRLRTKYGSGPVWIRNPMGPQLLVLSADQAEEILACTPTPYSPASNEKTASLAHFEPHVSLISAGSERAARRRFNEQILDSRNSRHRLAERFREISTEEMGKSVQSAAANAEFQWDGFAASWNRIVRRIVLGDSARDDAGLTDMLARLRRNANLAFAYPRNRTLQARLIARVGDYIDRGEQGSLAELIAAPFDGITQPVHQAMHWLFAFDAGGIGTFRTLALLAVHDEILSRARAEAWSRSAEVRSDLPFLRACFTDVLRLWPTTPVLLRQTTRPVVLGAAEIPADAGIVIFAPFFHRDRQRLPDADRLNPSRWLDHDPAAAHALFPFSAGPGACPGRHVVSSIAADVLATLIRNDLRLISPPLQADRDLPHTLNHFAIRLCLRHQTAWRASDRLRSQMA